MYVTSTTVVLELLTYDTPPCMANSSYLVQHRQDVEEFIQGQGRVREHCVQCKMADM
jgi:hypothetical protein